MEYMALGLPVIATDRGDTIELVIHGDTGFWFPRLIGRRWPAGSNISSTIPMTPDTSATPAENG
jgi:hypothetical protein